MRLSCNNRLPARLVAIILACGLFVAGQEFRGRIQGMVADASGGVMPGVSLVLRNIGTGVEVSRTSNEQGLFVFDCVDPGTYSLTCELRGFKRFIQQNIAVLFRRFPLHGVRVGETIQRNGSRHRPPLSQFCPGSDQSLRRERSLKHASICQYRDVRPLLPG